MTIRYINPPPKSNSGYYASEFLNVEFIRKYDWLLIFLFALSIRMIFWKSLGPLFSAVNGDSIEYYITSINLQPHKLFKLMWGYEHWYVRTPGYVLFLHLINRELIVQVILSSIGCVLMYRMNKIAGIMWIFYLQDIIHSFQYNKECLLLFCVITAIYILRNNMKWLVIAVPIILAGFVSYGGVIASNTTLGKGFMLNFWHLWQPSFNISIAYGKIFVYLQALPYIFAMLYFIRHVKIISVEFAIFVFLSALYSSIYSEPRYRELFMPFLFLLIAHPLELYIRRLDYKKILNLNIIINKIDKYKFAYKPIVLRIVNSTLKSFNNFLPENKERFIKLPY